MCTVLYNSVMYCTLLSCTVRCFVVSYQYPLLTCKNMKILTILGWLQVNHELLCYNQEINKILDCNPVFLYTLNNFFLPFANFFSTHKYSVRCCCKYAVFQMIYKSSNICLSVNILNICFFSHFLHVVVAFITGMFITVEVVITTCSSSTTKCSLYEIQILWKRKMR